MARVSDYLLAQRKEARVLFSREVEFLSGEKGPERSRRYVPSLFDVRVLWKLY